MTPTEQTWSFIKYLNRLSLDDLVTVQLASAMAVAPGVRQARKDEAFREVALLIGSLDEILREPQPA